MQNERDPNLSAGAQNIPTLGASNFTQNTMRVPAGMEGIAVALQRHAQSGANWFFWIAALSMINSLVLLAANGRWNFLAGLGVTQLIDALALGMSENLGGTTTTIIALLLDVMVAGIFVGLGLFARKGQTWAFALGMVIYVLDALLFLFVQDWLSVAFHAYVIYRLYKGFASSRKLKMLEAEAATPVPLSNL